MEGRFGSPLGANVYLRSFGTKGLLEQETATLVGRRWQWSSGPIYSMIVCRCDVQELIQVSIDRIFVEIFEVYK